MGTHVLLLLISKGGLFYIKIEGTKQAEEEERRM